MRNYRLLMYLVKRKLDLLLGQRCIVQVPSCNSFTDGSQDFSTQYSAYKAFLVRRGLNLRGDPDFAGREHHFGG